MNSTPEDPQPETTLAADTEVDATESKSQRKRNAHQITELAGMLVQMKPKVLATLPLEPDILEAIKHCAEIKAHGARKRQLHFVSKLLRATGNIEELQSQVLYPDLAKKKQAVENPHKEFRNQLIADFGGTVEALREKYPNVEQQRVSQLVRNAHAEHKKVCDAIQNSEGDATPPSINNTKAAKSLLKVLTKGG